MMIVYRDPVVQMNQCDTATVSGKKKEGRSQRDLETASVEQDISVGQTSTSCSIMFYARDQKEINQ
jgi:hypothetical protein